MKNPAQTQHEDFPNTQSWDYQQREDYFIQHQGLIHSTIHKVVRYHQESIRDASIDHDDLYQIASFAFWAAFDKYDPNRGAKFTTYAVDGMKKALRNVFRRNGAKKRTPPQPIIPIDPTKQDGEIKRGADNKKVDSASSAPSLDSQCIYREFSIATEDLLEELFDEEDRLIFNTLTHKEESQKSLAKRLGYSQARISMRYMLITIMLGCYFAERTGYSFDDLPL